MSAGLAINPPTPVEPHLDLFDGFDLALVMSVNPGFSGQSFIGSVLNKVRTLRARYDGKLPIEMDGGLGTDTLLEAIEAGCRVAVAGSAFFGQNSDNWPYLTQTWKGMLPSDCATSAQCCCRKQQTNTE